MSDGVLWSVQADFLARLADWDSDEDPAWPLQQAERAALFELNVPLLTISGDGREITDTSGVTIPTSAAPGLERARERMRRLDTQEIAWQVDVIRQTSTFLGGHVGGRRPEATRDAPGDRGESGSLCGGGRPDRPRDCV